MRARADAFVGAGDALQQSCAARRMLVGGGRRQLNLGRRRARGS